MRSPATHQAPGTALYALPRFGIGVLWPSHGTVPQTGGCIDSGGVLWLWTDGRGWRHVTDDGAWSPEARPELPADCEPYIAITDSVTQLIRHAIA